MAMVDWLAFFLTCFLLEERRGAKVSIISHLKSIKTKITITTFWNVCNVAMETSQNGWYGI